MKWIGVSIMLVVSLFAGEEINKKWESNENCQTCHKEISEKWETSRHSNSHFSKNDLFKKSLMYIVEKNPAKILNEVKTDCATCHNPRLTIGQVSKDDKISLLMEHESTQKEYDTALNTKI